MELESALVVNRESDNQVSPTKDARKLFEALQSRKNGYSEILIVPKAGHNFKVSSSVEANVFDGPMAPITLAKLGSCRSGCSASH